MVFAGVSGHDSRRRRQSGVLATKASGVLVGVLVSVMSGACSRQQPQPPAGGPVMAGTVKDIMDSMVNPSSDFLFDSVAEIADERGITQKAPHTAEEWKAVRRQAIQLLEAPSLLAMEGRRVARPSERSENPQIELQPEEIQTLVDADRASFVRRARRLQDAASSALDAIDKKDTTALFHAIEGIDKACEGCHLHYWYPNDQRAQQAAKAQGLVD